MSARLRTSGRDWKRCHFRVLKEVCVGTAAVSEAAATTVVVVVVVAAAAVVVVLLVVVVVVAAARAHTHTLFVYTYGH